MCPKSPPHPARHGEGMRPSSRRKASTESLLRVLHGQGAQETALRLPPEKASRWDLHRDGRIGIGIGLHSQNTSRLRKRDSFLGIRCGLHRIEDEG